MLGVQIPARAEILFKISAPPALPRQLGYDEYTVSAKTVRERTGHPSSYAEAKKMKLLTLHTHGSSRTSLRDCYSSSLTRALHYSLQGYVHSRLHSEGQPSLPG